MLRFIPEITENRFIGCLIMFEHSFLATVYTPGFCLFLIVWLLWGILNKGKKYEPGKRPFYLSEKDRDREINEQPRFNLPPVGESTRQATERFRRAAETGKPKKYNW